MSAGSVTVRMYRRILGDCFLLMIGPDDRGDRSHILIDCGVLQGVAGAKDRMREIVEDIRLETGGRLDCIVVTHEHFDHMSGFDYANDLFDQFDVGTLWLAWTEDPDDPLACELQERFAASHRALAAMAIAAGMDQGIPADDDEEHIVGLAGFRGVQPDLGALAAGTAERGSRRTFTRLRGWARDVAYLQPGDVLDTPTRANGPSIRAYVLGPPRDPKYLFKALPSRGEAKETYLEFADPAGVDDRQAHSPFAPQFRWYAEEGGGPAPEFVERHYRSNRGPCRFEGDVPAGHDCTIDFECGQRQDYRRIDDLAEMTGGALALKLDSNTNNSSLVIAFELPDRGTLLFAADAQVGNWLSWESVAFREKNGGAPVATTSADLLSRARLYKVGHHGSHNATLRAKGLEAMTSGKLAVMIPTVEQVALRQGSKGWLMPNPETYKGLIVQSRGRIMRGDMTVEQARKGAASLLMNDPELRGVELDYAFEAQSDTDDYVDFRLDL